MNSSNEVNTMATVTVDPMGKVGLPEDIFQTSHIQPGAELVVFAEVGKITLIDREQVLRERMKAVDDEMRARLRQALEAGGEASFFAGLPLKEYLALSEEEDKALWNRLLKEAEREVKIIEHEIPPHFRPAGQRHGARGPARHRSR
jgi:hypothetical protein